MNLVRRLAILSLVGAAIASTCLADEKWGSIKGKFVYDADKAPEPKPLDVPARKFGPIVAPTAEQDLLVDAKSMGVQNIVVYLIDESVAIHPRYDARKATPVELGISNASFSPRIVTLWTEQPLRITNRDPLGHDVVCNPKRDDVVSVSLAPNQSKQVRFSRSQTLPQPFASSVYYWTKGYVLPRATPYAASTNADGEFEIRDIPAGVHAFQVWHERSGYLLADPTWVAGRKKGIANWTIEDQKLTDLGTIKVDPRLFQ